MLGHKKCNSLRQKSLSFFQVEYAMLDKCDRTLKCDDNIELFVFFIRCKLCIFEVERKQKVCDLLFRAAKDISEQKESTLLSI